VDTAQTLNVQCHSECGGKDAVIVRTTHSIEECVCRYY